MLTKNQTVIAMTIAREIALRPPFVMGHEAWAACYHCGALEDEAHENSCLFKRAQEFVKEVDT